MDLGYLFSSFEGRISRKRYWTGVLILVAAAMVVMVLLFLSGLDVTGSTGAFVGLLIELAFLYPATALMVKRLHDRRRPSWFAAFILAPLVLKAITDAAGITAAGTGSGILDILLGVVIFVVSLWFLVDLGFLRGTIGDNEYGPDPVAPRMAAP